jgi:hypothetical protein
MNIEVCQIVFHLHNTINGQCADVFTVGMPAEILYNNAFIHNGKIVEKINIKGDNGILAEVVFEGGEKWFQWNIDGYGTKIIEDGEGTKGEA